MKTYYNYSSAIDYCTNEKGKIELELQVPFRTLNERGLSEHLNEHGDEPAKAEDFPAFKYLELPSIVLLLCHLAPVLFHQLMVKLFHNYCSSRLGQLSL